MFSLNGRSIYHTSGSIFACSEKLLKACAFADLEGNYLLEAAFAPSYGANMGFNLDDAKLLAELSKSGTNLKETLTLGRQQIFFTPSDLIPHLKSFSEPSITSFLSATHDRGPAEPLLELLGAERVTSLDFSGYEGATIQHDLNRSVDSSLHDRFDAVIDGGTLEHVFNFPTAVQNAMEMVKVGGSLLLFTPANNQFGHGFYQFSPELFFNIFSESNGYRVKNMVAVELSPAHRQFTVSDPSTIRERVTLTNSWPVSLFVHAERVKKTPLFTQVPQQTDYQAAWRTNSVVTDITLSSPNSPTQVLSAKSKLKKSLVTTAPSLIGFFTTFRQVFLRRDTGFKNSKFFKPRSNA